VRVAIVAFVGTLILLAAMGLMWLFIRVESASAFVPPAILPLAVVASGKDFGCGQRNIVIFNDDWLTLVG
jgi:hypothetical protein